MSIVITVWLILYYISLFITGIFEPVVQPALGVLMIGAAGGGKLFYKLVLVFVFVSSLSL